MTKKKVSKCGHLKPNALIFQYFRKIPSVMEAKKKALKNPPKNVATKLKGGGGKALVAGN